MFNSFPRYCFKQLIDTSDYVKRQTSRRSRRVTMARRTKLNLHPVIKISFYIFSITRLQTKNSKIKKTTPKNKSREWREQEIKLIKSGEIDWVAVEIGPLKKRHL